MMMIEDGDYIVRVIDYKDTAIRGATFVDNDGFANIYINARVSTNQQKETFNHELLHVENDDCYNDKPIELVESLTASTGKVPIDTIYRRGFDLFRLSPNDPFWAKLWDIWALQHERDILRIVSKAIDGYTQKQAKHMFDSIFSPWIAYHKTETI